MARNPPDTGTRWTFHASRPHIDPGNRYAQRVDALTPTRNVSRIVDGMGVRMEDYVFVDVHPAPRSAEPVRRGGDAGDASDRRRLLASLPRRATSARYGSLLVIIADGHGSVAVRASSGGADMGPHGKLAPHQVGGYECASLAAQSVAHWVGDVSAFFAAAGYSLGDLTDTGAHALLADAFAHAQRRCVEETARGALVPDTGAQHSRREDAPEQRRRRQRLEASLIDGGFFSLLHESALASFTAPPTANSAAVSIAATTTAATTAGATTGAIKSAQADAPAACFLAHDKVLVPYSPQAASTPSGFVVCYENRTRGTRIPAEYGATLTAALFVVREDEMGARATVHVANAGDTDAYLYRLGDRHAGVPVRSPIRLTTDHTGTSAAEVQRLARHGMVHDGKHFRPLGGPYRNFGIQPTRSCGHTLLGLHGIVSDPDCTSTALEPGDAVVVATDGLWGDLAGPPPSNGPLALLSDEERAAIDVGAILARTDERGDSGAVEPDVCARAVLQELVGRVPRGRDNVALVVVRVGLARET